MQPEPLMSPLASAPETDLDRASLEFYQHAMRLMQEGNLPFLVGGAYALARYTGIERHTKDFDVFIRREGRYWRALFAHVLLFGFIYPSDRSKVPSWVMAEMSERLAEETKRGDLPEKICYGTIVSRQQYLVDVKEWGYRDARLEPLGNMSEEEIEEWTRGIEVDGHK